MSMTTTQVLVRDSDQHPEQSVPSMTQQAVVQITLTGPFLVLAIVAIIVSIQIMKPAVACGLLILLPLASVIYNDYNNFLALGPGGTPATFLGYLKITYLRLFALSDPYSPPTFHGKVSPSTGYFYRTRSWLPKRNGPRPQIAGIAPQRQLDQSGCGQMYRTLRTSLSNLAAKDEETFRIGTSCFEKKGLALFARNPINATCRGEVCHVHHSDRSMHMNLHPDDAKVVLEMGWGERHPLARGGWMSAYVPREFVMVYAPRDRGELEAVCRIIKAAGYWVTGDKKFEFKIENKDVHATEGVQLDQKNGAVQVAVGQEQTCRNCSGESVWR
ncbi:Uncharacterized protein BP5553_02278 [Venustampulla echinocandica]|uniref:Luciferase domain-containing protein n=1 Tax=Venustampulla echinocandica TaxID=2656787 RepID=A0A370U3E2_9HELO|nr:Uncharacterized protein BP5553_02278 [Venustampulla echinocandica]RDL42299.1 Uncharacterized protein BP5553_02278 [Venustampulla echinocandica]